MAVTRASRSAKPEARGPADLEARHDGRPYMGDSTGPAGCGPLAPSERALQAAELVSLIVVPKVSGTTRRCSSAMGTRRRRCGLWVECEPAEGLPSPLSRSCMDIRR